MWPLRPDDERSRPLYVQYGCGLCAPERWLNFDASPRLWLERLPMVRTALRFGPGCRFPANVRYGDIARGLPVPDGAAAGVYCSHVLEHLPRETVPSVLQRTLRMLRPGGRFRLVVPDLQWRAQDYVLAASSGASDAADIFIDRCHLGRWPSRDGVVGFAQRLFGHSAHLWMYDYGLMKSLLDEAGFVSVRRCQRGDSGDAVFSAVEDDARFVESGRRELAIEALKPL